jgi:hypothetical protein
MSSDPWTTFLEWLTTVFVPAWGELIGLLPYIIVGTIVGPILMILVLMWGWHLVSRRRGKVRHAELQPAAAARDGDGLSVFPVNEPYCEQHALVFPPRATACTIDGGALEVACPVDGTLRDAEVDTCSGCGTKFKLGATSPGSVVLSSDGPPEGGAAIA